MSGERFPRINCVVPGCRRGTTRYPPQHDEIVCGKCWRFVSPGLKRRRRLVATALRRLDAKIGTREPTAEEARQGLRLYRLENRMWTRAKAQAIEGAAGI